MTDTIMPITKHEGRNVKRIREILGVKQDALATTLGINQQKMSFIESKEKIDDEQMKEIAKALNVPVEAIRNFNEDAVFNKILTFNDNSTMNDHSSFNYQCTINSLEKQVELLEENKKLYERLLQVEKEKNALYEKLLSEKNI